MISKEIALLTKVLTETRSSLNTQELGNLESQPTGRNDAEEQTKDRNETESSNLDGNDEMKEQQHRSTELLNRINKKEPETDPKKVNRDETDMMENTNNEENETSAAGRMDDETMFET